MNDEPLPQRTSARKGQAAARREMDRRRYELQRQKRQTSQQQVANESIRTLLEVVRYLNSVQDGDAWRIEQTYNKTEIDKSSRILNCHEEDIMNASLITMKRLIQSLLPPAERAKPRTQTAVEAEPDALDEPA